MLTVLIIGAPTIVYLAVKIESIYKMKKFLRSVNDENK